MDTVEWMYEAADPVCWTKGLSVEAVGAPVVVEAMTKGDVVVVDVTLTGAVCCCTGSMVPVQAEPSGQQATCPAASAEQTCDVRQQRPGSLRLLQAA